MAMSVIPSLAGLIIHLLILKIIRLSAEDVVLTGVSQLRIMRLSRSCVFDL